MRIVIEVEVGNEAMTHPADIGATLRRAASRIGNERLELGDTARILDLNGNTVGHWEVIDV
jgi:hypothetical protein